MHGCKISQLPDWLPELTELKYLTLIGCPIPQIPDWFAKLTALEYLSLDSATAQAPLAERIAFPPSLDTLLFSELKFVPNWVRRVSKLKSLNFYDLQGDLPEWLGELSQLKVLSLYSTHIYSLPNFLQNLPKIEVKFVASYIEGVPAEILSTQNNQKILDYYFQYIAPQDALPLYEFKLIVVGRGGVGKTSLVHKLDTGNYKEFGQTPGIAITPWSVEIDGHPVRAYVWDFGGQEIMHGTHRFFMTERALYLVLISGREGNAQRDAHYWLSLVRAFAGDKVPILVLAHRSQEWSFELKEQELRRTYGDSLVFLRTDSKDEPQIAALRAEIVRQARQLPGMSDLWPSAWRQVKQELPEQKQSWLSFSEFSRFCRERGVAELKDQHALADCLHALGLMLCYREHPVLHDIGVLNPLWVTDGIYQMLNSPLVRAAHGEFTLATFAAVLGGEQAERYPVALHPYLLSLMRKFNLCLPIDKHGLRFLIPDLLSKEEPAVESEFPTTRSLCFSYRYERVLPEGLLPRFIVETYVHREPACTWSSGVVLRRRDSRVLVRADLHARTIIIRVNGGDSGSRRELLGLVRGYFENIHSSYQGLVVTEEVPLPDHPQLAVPYQELIDYYRDGDDVYKRSVEGRVRKYSVRQLLDGVDLPGEWQSGLPERYQELGASKDPLSVFISYAEQDSQSFDHLSSHLRLHERRKLIQVWGQGHIQAGQDASRERSTNLARADVVVLLLSIDFWKSRSCIEEDLQNALGRRGRGQAEVIPIVIRAFDYESTELRTVKPIRVQGKPVTEHADPDEAWLSVIHQMDPIFQRLRAR